MSWVFLLIQLLPSIIKLIQLVREAIADAHPSDRFKLRKEMHAMARRHVQELALEQNTVLSIAAAGDVEAVETRIAQDWLTFRDRVAGKPAA